MAERIVFLVPGFFGFSSVGAVSYFEDVERVLGTALQRRGVDARIVCCRTQPTASIRRRAEALRLQVQRSAGLKARELHFVGHSTGGLDVRLLLAPGLRMAGGDVAARIARRTRSAISVATPHRGTPLANHFLSVQGQTLLLLLSALATSGQGRGLIVATARALALAAKVDDWLDRDPGALERLAEGLLQQLSLKRSDPLWRYLRQIQRDQGAAVQLTPEGIDLFAAAVADRPGIDYACVVAGVPRPRESLKPAELLDPEYLVLRALFRLLHALASRPHPHYPYPEPDVPVRAAIERAFGFELSARTSDGVVPSLSQLHGRLLHAARADHLDVVGHYTLAGRTADWLPSGAGFTPEAFEAAWEAVAGAIASPQPAAAPTPAAAPAAPAAPRRRAAKPPQA